MTGSQRVAGWCAAALVAGALLAFDPAGWMVFAPIKWTAVTVSTGAAAAAVIAGRRVFADQRTATVWLVLLAWIGLASSLALDGSYAWLGTPDRHFGALTWLLCAGAFLVGQNLHGRARWLVLRSVVVSGLGIGVYAVAEAAGHPPVELDLGTSRLGGPFGSPAYLGAACVLVLPIATGVLASRDVSRTWRAAAGVACGGAGYAALASQTRGAWVGLLVAGGIGAVSARRWVLARGRSVSALAALAVVVAVVTPVGARAVSSFDLGEGTAGGRLDEWRIAVQVVADRPLTGTGPEGYRIAFPAAVDAAYEREHGRDVVPDRAHDSLLDVAATLGLPGALLVVALWAAVARRVRSLLRGPTREPWALGASAALAGYLAQQLFLFPLAEVDPVAWLVAGMVVAAAPTPARKSVTLPRPLAVVPAAAVVVALLSGFADVAADREARAALDRVAAGDLDGAAGHARAAVRLRPGSIVYQLVAADVAARSGTREGFSSAADHVEDGLERSPRDPVLRARRAELILDLAELTGRLDDALAAAAAWDGVVAGDPNNGGHRLAQGVARALAGDVAGAREAFEVATDLAPADPAPWVGLAVLDLGAGDETAARVAAERALALDPDHPTAREVLRRVDRDR